MATTEVFIISLVAHKAIQGINVELLWFALTIGTGGGFGAILAMYLHKRHIK